jgi:hypothetical protein
VEAKRIHENENVQFVHMLLNPGESLIINLLFLRLIPGLCPVKRPTFRNFKLDPILF